MTKPHSRDLERLLDLELERNERVRAAVAAYQELAEGEKALFRLAQHGEDEANEEKLTQPTPNHREESDAITPGGPSLPPH